MSKRADRREEDEIAARGGLVVATVLNRSRGVQIQKKAGDTLIYKPTIRNISAQAIRAKVWCQVGIQEFLLGIPANWNSAEGSEAEGVFDLPPGNSVVTLTGRIPADIFALTDVWALVGGNYYDYDCRVEIRDPANNARLDYWDSYDEIRVTVPGTPSDALKNLSVIGMGYE